MAPPHAETLLTQRTSVTPSSPEQVDLHLKTTSLSPRHTFQVPEVTIKQLRDAVPAHCFKRDTLRSLSYVLVDLVGVVTLVTAATWGIPLLPGGPMVRALGWILYSILQGIVCTGLWVLAHECGHQAFSPSKVVNTTVGFLIHSLLLVPYQAWRISHAQHHAATGHMTRDQVFVPPTRSTLGLLSPSHDKKEGEEEEDSPLWEDTPISALYGMVGMLLIGWPYYLFANASGQRHYPPGTSHFNPHSPMYTDAQGKPKYSSQILFSTLGVLTVALGLLLATLTWGALPVFLYYGLPYFQVNAWLVLITYLQHTDPDLPHYREKEWTFVRGALLTIDRDWGFFLNTALHHITDTHIAHHLFSQMPHYHAQEATKAIRSVLGPHYRMDTSPPWKALWRAYNACHFVEDEGDIVFYKR
ncbi:MAG: delta 12 fatty acid desaturase [Piptocephalis tieghemiana]|nr:MAG: delta 12 fatty acid desaturase [Piptocephalis tieghemiana]